MWAIKKTAWQFFRCVIGVRLQNRELSQNRVEIHESGFLKLLAVNFQKWAGSANETDLDAFETTMFCRHYSRQNKRMAVIFSDSRRIVTANK